MFTMRNNNIGLRRRARIQLQAGVDSHTSGIGPLLSKLTRQHHSPLSRQPQPNSKPKQQRFSL